MANPETHTDKPRQTTRERQNARARERRKTDPEWRKRQNEKRAQRKRRAKERPPAVSKLQRERDSETEGAKRAAAGARAVATEIWERATAARSAAIDAVLSADNAEAEWRAADEVAKKAEAMALGIARDDKRLRKTFYAREHLPVAIEAQGGICWWCHKPLPADLSEIVADHWVPIAVGGSTGKENLAALHPRCNSQKGTKIPTAPGPLSRTR